MAGNVTVFLVTLFLTLVACGLYPWGVWLTWRFIHLGVADVDEYPQWVRGALAAVWPATWTAWLMIVMVVLLRLAWNSRQPRDGKSEAR